MPCSLGSRLLVLRHNKHICPISKAQWMLQPLKGLGKRRGKEWEWSCWLDKKTLLAETEFSSSKSCKIFQATTRRLLIVARSADRRNGDVLSGNLPAFLREEKLAGLRLVSVIAINIPHFSWLQHWNQKKKLLLLPNMLVKDNKVDFWTELTELKKKLWSFQLSIPIPGLLMTIFFDI